MTQAVVLVEEQSAKIVVAELARRIGLEPAPIVIGHEGKSDLERSISNKIRNWRVPNRTRFVILRDNDGGDCRTLKQSLLDLTPQDARTRVKVRIVLQELEAWYFADAPALFAAGLISKAESEKMPKQAKYRNCDTIPSPKAELQKLLEKKRVAETGQILLARRIAPHLSLDKNRSTSFQHLIDALRWASDSGRDGNR